MLIKITDCFLFSGVLCSYFARRTQFKECRSGYFGEYCEKKCPYPTYGMYCQSYCDCVEKDCNYNTGCLESITKSETNFTKKEEAVSINAKPSNIRTDDTSESERNPDIGCKNGFFGIFCEKKCPYPSYGLDCQSFCDCAVELCSYRTGCLTPTVKSVLVSERNLATNGKVMAITPTISSAGMNVLIQTENLLENKSPTSVCIGNIPERSKIQKSVGLMISVIIVGCFGVILLILYLSLVAKECRCGRVSKIILYT